MPVGRTRYSRALASFEHDPILATLSDDVTMTVAVHDEPLKGKDTAGFLFEVLLEELTPFELTGEIVEGHRSIVLFETSVRGVAAHGLDAVELDAAGLVRALTVFFRPLPALQLISEVGGARMAARFGELEREGGGGL